MPDLSSALHLAASELTLAVGALVLLMVGAFIGDKSARLVSILSVLLLIAASVIAVVGPWGEGHRELHLSGDRPQIRRATVMEVCELAIGFLRKDECGPQP